MNKTLLTIIGALLVLGMAQFAHAVEAGCFNIELDVKDDQVKPGETFTLKVTVENNSTMDMDDDEDVEITVDSMDDGSDDYEDDGTIDQLDNNDDDKIEFDIEVPYTIDEGDYDIKVTVSGETTNGTKCETTVNSSVEVKKDKHELIMQAPLLSQETLKCARSLDVSTTLWNIGDKDEDIEYSVYNTELGISQKDSFSIDSGSDEDDIKSTRTTTLDLKDVKAGSYTFYIKAAYDSNNKQKTSSFNVKVEDCATTKPVTTTPVVNTTPVVVQTTTAQPTATQPLVTVPAIIEEPTFMEQYGAILLLGLAYVVVIVVGILLVVSLIRKRD